ncbi:MAG: phage terminase large subunit, partial [Gammaproteobacteria bacterium]|nr:phage terminase large subunit [Gammaproteobacteria bacterium]
DYNGQSFRFTFPNKSTVALGGMSMDKQLAAQRGSQYGGVVFDELTLFKKKMFWYMMTRMRTMSGAVTFIKATTNPEPEGWVKDLLEEAGYLDKETGFAIYSMSGVLRWFYMGEDDKLVWFDSRKEALHWWKAEYPDQWQRYLNGRDWLLANPGKSLSEAKQAGIDCRTLRNPKSFTFIPSTLSDNAKMLDVIPDYESNLEEQPLEDRMALLHGCWKNFGNSGEHFKESMCTKISKNELPSDITAWLGCDLAYTAKDSTNDPDYTCFTLLGRSASTKKIYVLDSFFHRVAATDIADKIKTVFDKYANDDCIKIEGVSIPQDPAAGKGNVGWMAQDLVGLNVHSSTERGGQVSATGRKINPKVTRFLPFASQAKLGNVVIVRHDNMDKWLHQLVSFPTGKNDDAVDATSRAFDRIAEDANAVPMFGSYN